MWRPPLYRLYIILEYLKGEAHHTVNPQVMFVPQGVYQLNTVRKMLYATRNCEKREGV